MERVKMVVAGRQAEVDADQVKKLAKKDIRLNRTIRHNVRFL